MIREYGCDRLTEGRIYCPECDGEGRFDEIYNGDQSRAVVCEECGGCGEVEPRCSECWERSPWAEPDGNGGYLCQECVDAREVEADERRAVASRVWGAGPKRHGVGCDCDGCVRAEDLA